MCASQRATCGSTAISSLRQVATTVIASLRPARVRKIRKSSVALSAHCRSSITSTSRPCRATAASSSATPENSRPRCQPSARPPWLVSEGCSRGSSRAASTRAYGGTMSSARSNTAPPSSRLSASSVLRDRQERQLLGQREACPPGRCQAARPTAGPRPRTGSCPRPRPPPPAAGGCSRPALTAGQTARAHGRRRPVTRPCSPYPPRASHPLAPRQAKTSPRLCQAEDTPGPPSTPPSTNSLFPRYARPAFAGRRRPAGAACADRPAAYGTKKIPTRFQRAVKRCGSLTAAMSPAAHTRLQNRPA